MYYNNIKSSCVFPFARIVPSQYPSLTPVTSSSPFPMSTPFLFISLRSGFMQSLNSLRPLVWRQSGLFVSSQTHLNTIWLKQHLMIKMHLSRQHSGNSLSRMFPLCNNYSCSCCINITTGTLIVIVQIFCEFLAAVQWWKGAFHSTGNGKRIPMLALESWSNTIFNGPFITSPANIEN